MHTELFGMLFGTCKAIRVSGDNQKAGDPDRTRRLPEGENLQVHIKRREGGRDNLGQASQDSLTEVNMVLDSF
jgi:hypothetical protein